MEATQPHLLPEIGNVVVVRGKRFLVEGIEEDPAGITHIVSLACLEDDSQGELLSVLWEHEPDARIIEGTSWKSVTEKGFDKPHLFSAFLHTLRWNCVTSTNANLFQSPYRAGIQVQAFQLEPLRKALSMPRVNLFIADDVGLGKTIEAGLILRELLMRQRVKRVVISCPRSVVLQWRDEMEQRFGLPFVVLDREYIANMRIERGYGVNPWNTHNRFIISHSLIRDAAYSTSLRDWLKEYTTGSLLILDEAHNAAPATGSRYAVDSKLTKTIRDIAPLFEHRLFLSATPHNGHSNSFSTLMSLLDPQRFLPGVPIKEPEELKQILIRRLKSDLRGLGEDFPERRVIQVVCDGLPEDNAELKLSSLLQEYRETCGEELKTEIVGRRNASQLVISTLQKRLLSSIKAFYRTINVHKSKRSKQANSQVTATIKNALSAPDANDDRAELTDEELAQEQDSAMDTLFQAAAVESGGQKSLELLEEMTQIAKTERFNADSKVVKLKEWIKKYLCPDLGKPGAKWLNRRVVIFTEYTDTKDYLKQELEDFIRGSDQAEDRIAVFHGSLGDDKRELIKSQFNGSPEEFPLRILIATDAAREGVNLQNNCYDLFHFDIPWNPSRMEQRNGRIDRKLQSHPHVNCYYFTLPQRPEDRVLEVMVNKLETINKQLGVLSPVIDKMVEKALTHGIAHDKVTELSDEIETVDKKGKSGSQQDVINAELESARIRDDDRSNELKKEIQRLEHMLADSKKWIGLEDQHFMDAISASLEMMDGDELQSTANKDEWAIPALNEKLAADPDWASTLDSLRAPRDAKTKIDQWRKESPIRPVVFKDPNSLDGKVVHLHLEHRLVQRLFSRFRSQGFQQDDLSRACVVRTDDPVPKVVLFGRLAMYGENASRLHDEVVAVAAEWTRPESDGKHKLTPLPDNARDVTLKLLEDSVRRGSDQDIAEITMSMLRKAAEADVDGLKDYLIKLAEERQAGAEKDLAKRGNAEAISMTQILEKQRNRIKSILKEHEGKDKTKMLEWAEDEQDQMKAETDYWQRRLKAIPAELKSEPARVKESFVVKSSRIEPIGLVYLWPKSSSLSG